MKNAMVFSVNEDTSKVTVMAKVDKVSCFYQEFKFFESASVIKFLKLFP